MNDSFTENSGSISYFMTLAELRLLGHIVCKKDGAALQRLNEMTQDSTTDTDWSKVLDDLVLKNYVTKVVNKVVYDRGIGVIIQIIAHSKSVSFTDDGKSRVFLDKDVEVCMSEDAHRNGSFILTPKRREPGFDFSEQ